MVTLSAGIDAWLSSRCPTPTTAVTNKKLNTIAPNAKTRPPAAVPLRRRQIGSCCGCTSGASSSETCVQPAQNLSGNHHAVLGNRPPDSYLLGSWGESRHSQRGQARAQRVRRRIGVRVAAAAEEGGALPAWQQQEDDGSEEEEDFDALNQDEVCALLCAQASTTVACLLHDTCLIIKLHACHQYGQLT